MVLFQPIGTPAALAGPADVDDQLCLSFAGDVDPGSRGAARAASSKGSQADQVRLLMSGSTVALLQVRRDEALEAALQGPRTSPRYSNGAILAATRFRIAR
jgi:hypothetical protein